MVTERQEIPALTGDEVSALPEKRSLRVLVVEDNLDSAESLRMLLQLCGYDARIAHTGREGVKAAERIRPDIVICDIGLPDMDGFDVARALRRSPQTSAVRLIAVTGYTRDQDRLRATEAGFDLHLAKPVDPQVLLSRLEK